MALAIELRGHDLRYAAEQALMAFLPAFGGEDKLVSTLLEDRAVAELSFQGGESKGEAPLPVPLPEQALLRKRVLQRSVKESIYRAAVAVLGTEPPWGSLTGVRPGKLAARHMEGLPSRNARETAAWLAEEYHLSPRRAALCARAAETGLRVRDCLAPGDIILYVGIPFCPTRCAYCSFVSHSVEKSLKLVEPYVEALLEEMESAGRLAREAGLRVRAVYWGGGTPTTLSESQLARTLDALAEAFDLSANLEYTVEAGRPDTVTPEKLAVLRSRGVGRISLNPQTMDDRVLEAIGRRHTAEDIRRSFSLARERFPGQINMDLIAGLPADSTEGFCRSLEEVMALDPENITVHTLTRKRGADLNGMALSAPDGAAVGTMLDYAMERLTAGAYAPYYLYRQKFSAGGFENVGWAREGTECFYNVAMMEELCSVLSLGAGGATKRILPGGKILRCFNRKYPYEYIGSLEAAGEEKRKLFLGPETA